MKSMTDLFRPFMDPEAAFALAALLTPDPQTGRLYIGQGERVDLFEAALQTLLGCAQDVLTTNSCTSALDLALHLCGVGGPRGDDRPSMLTQRDLVISTPMTCVSYLTPVLLADGTTAPIGQIVNQRLTPEVLSYDTVTGRFVSKRVTGWTKIPVAPDRWRRLTHDVARGSRGHNGRRGIWITGDHRVWTERGFVAIDRLSATDYLATNEKAAFGTVASLIDGTMLGDASIRERGSERRHGRFMFTHTLRQGAWVDLKRAVLEGFSPTTHYKEAYKQTHASIAVAVPAGATWDEQRARWYPRGKKIVPRDIEISPVLLAAWYLDDGSRQGNKITLCTEGFDDDSVLFLLEKLRQFGIFPSVLRHRNGGLRLFIGNGGYGSEEHYSAERFFTYIAPYVPDSMRYKLPDWAAPYENDRWFDDGGVTNLYARPIVDQCVPPEDQKPGMAYCIEVEDTHTFIAGGMVLSNCSATNSPIVTRGGRILWADVDPLTGLIDPVSVDDQIERAMTRYGIVPSAIMAVDWGGQLVNYPSLRQVAAREEIPIIQDAAHSFGARIEGRSFLHPDAISPGGFPWHGDYVCFSFQAIKALTTGDGGALICPDDATTERARLLRWYGLDRRSSQDFRCAQRIEEVGYKYHLNDIAATLGLVNLPSVDGLLRDQRANAIVYGAELGGLDGVIVPYPFRGGDGSAADEDAPWWLFTLLVSDRDHFIGFLADRGIAASPVHARNDLHPGFRQAVLEECPLPGVDFFAAHEVAIPVGWWVTPAEREHIVTVVRQWSTMHGGQLVPPKQYAEV